MIQNIKINILAILFAVSMFSCNRPTDAVSEMEANKSSSKTILSFGFQQKYNSALTADVNALSINNTSGEIVVVIEQITLISLKDLVATFSFDGSYVMVGTVIQRSTASANNYNYPLTYTVVAEDGSLKNYNVDVTFSCIAPYKPTAYSLALTSGMTYPIAGKTVSPEYTYRDANGDLEDGSILAWSIEDSQYSGTYSVYKSYLVSDDSLVDSGAAVSGAVKKSAAVLNVPSGMDGRRIKFSITPTSVMGYTCAGDSAYTVGSTISYSLQSSIKSGSGAGVIIREFQRYFSADDGTTESAAGYSHTLNEYVVLYNDSDVSYDLSGAKFQYTTDGVTWTDYCLFAAGESSFLRPRDSNGAIIEPISYTIYPNGYFLISRQESSSDAKGVSDIVLIANSSLNLPDSVGAIRLLDSTGKILDLVGYSGTTAPVFEGPSGQGGALVQDKTILRRKNADGAGDTDNNKNDFKSVALSELVGSGKNLLGSGYGPVITSGPSIEEVVYTTSSDATASTTINQKTYDKTFKAVYTYYNWKFYDEEGTIFKWEIVSAANGNPITFNSDDGVSHPINNTDANTFNFLEQDFDALPDGIIPMLKLSITPVATNGEVGDTKSVLMELLSPKPAKLQISRVFPTKNLVEIYVQKGGTLDRIKLASTAIKYNSAYKVYLPDTRVSNIDINNDGLIDENDTIQSQKFLLLQTKHLTTAEDADAATWNAMADVYAPGINTDTNAVEPYSLYDYSFRGLTVEILEEDESSSDEAGVTSYLQKDMVAYTLGTPSQSIQAFNRYVLVQNISNYFTGSSSYAWETSPGLPQSMIDAINATLNTDNSSGENVDLDLINFGDYDERPIIPPKPDDETIASYANILTDYINIPYASEDSFVLSRQSTLFYNEEEGSSENYTDFEDMYSASRKAGLKDLYFDWIGETEFMLHGVHGVAAASGLQLTTSLSNSTSTENVYICLNDSGQYVQRSLTNVSDVIPLVLVTMNYRTIVSYESLDSSLNGESYAHDMFPSDLVIVRNLNSSGTAFVDTNNLVDFTKVNAGASFSKR